MPLQILTLNFLVAASESWESSSRARFSRTDVYQHFRTASFFLLSIAPKISNLRDVFVGFRGFGSTGFQIIMHVFAIV
jgi:hypothetical protein